MPAPSARSRTSSPPEYADKLIEGLDGVDYIERVKVSQKNWIGKSTGAEGDFAITGKEDKKFYPKPMQNIHYKKSVIVLNFCVTLACLVVLLFSLLKVGPKV